MISVQCITKLCTAVGGFYKFRDSDGEFEGAIVEVEDDGHLILRDSKGMIREYQFKEVEFII